MCIYALSQLMQNHHYLVVVRLDISVSMLFTENRIAETTDRRKSVVCFFGFVWEFQ
jgi:hypothetical protein